MRPCILYNPYVPHAQGLTSRTIASRQAHLALDFWILEDAAVFLRDWTTTCATSLRIWLRKLAPACETGFSSAVPSQLPLPSPSQRGVSGVGP